MKRLVSPSQARVDRFAKRFQARARWSCRRPRSVHPGRALPETIDRCSVDSPPFRVHLVLGQRSRLRSAGTFPDRRATSRGRPQSSCSVSFVSSCSVKCRPAVGAATIPVRARIPFDSARDQRAGLGLSGCTWAAESGHIVREPRATVPADPAGRSSRHPQCVRQRSTRCRRAPRRRSTAPGRPERVCRGFCRSISTVPARPRGRVLPTGHRRGCVALTAWQAARGYHLGPGNHPASEIRQDREHGDGITSVEPVDDQSRASVRRAKGS